MSLTLKLSDSMEKQLRFRAALTGQNISVFVEQLVRQELDAPLTLTEAAEPLAHAVEEAGLSEDQYLTTLRKARNMARRNRKGGLNS